MGNPELGPISEEEITGKHNPDDGQEEKKTNLKVVYDQGAEAEKERINQINAELKTASGEKKAALEKEVESLETHLKLRASDRIEQGKPPITKEEQKQPATETEEERLMKSGEELMQKLDADREWNWTELDHAQQWLDAVKAKTKPKLQNMERALGHAHGEKHDLLDDQTQKLDAMLVALERKLFAVRAAYERREAAKRREQARKEAEPKYNELLGALYRLSESMKTLTEERNGENERIAQYKKEYATTLQKINALLDTFPSKQLDPQLRPEIKTLVFNPRFVEQGAIEMNQGSQFRKRFNQETEYKPPEQKPQNKAEKESRKARRDKAEKMEKAFLALCVDKSGKDTELEKLLKELDATSNRYSGELYKKQYHDRSEVGLVNLYQNHVKEAQKLEERFQTAGLLERGGTVREKILQILREHKDKYRTMMVQTRGKLVGPSYSERDIAENIRTMERMIAAMAKTF